MPSELKRIISASATNQQRSPSLIKILRGADGRWLIEGVGVVPDVEVENPPHATFNGGDRQLEVALDMLAKKLKEQPLRQFQAQPIPALKR